jgi:uncharacterized CHY-type Zn-finger protein
MCLHTTVPEQLGVCDSWKDILTDWGQVTLRLCDRGLCLMHPTGLAIVALRVQCCKVSSICQLTGIHYSNKREMGNSETNGLNSYYAVFNKHPEYINHGSGLVIIINTSIRAKHFKLLTLKQPTKNQFVVTIQHCR